MRRILRVALVVSPLLLLVRMATAQQYPVMDMVADRVVQKYQQASCEQLWQRKGQHKAPTQRDWENHLSTRLAVENPELRPTLVQIINGRGYDCRRIDMIWRANDDIDYTDFIIGCDTGQGPPYHTYELEFGKSGHWVLRSAE